MPKVKALDKVVTYRDSLVVMDSETGEVLDMSTTNKVTYKTGAHFLKAFCDNPLFFAPIPHSARTLLFALATLIPYASDKSPYVYFGGIVADQVMKQNGLHASTVKRNLKYLIEYGMIRRKGRAMYEVNPYLYAKGPSSAVLMLQKKWDMESPDKVDIQPTEQK